MEQIQEARSKFSDIFRRVNVACRNEQWDLALDYIDQGFAIASDNKRLHELHEQILNLKGANRKNGFSDVEHARGGSA